MNNNITSNVWPSRNFPDAVNKKEKLIALLADLTDAANKHWKSMITIPCTPDAANHNHHHIIIIMSMNHRCLYCQMLSKVKVQKTYCFTVYCRSTPTWCQTTQKPFSWLSHNWHILKWAIRNRWFYCCRAFVLWKWQHAVNAFNPISQNSSLL